ncbi:MAG TPA: protein kinase [Thermoanaerobaculia bacterium]|jgi:serine/threonine-protein kinase|nr:protein kinase [Thermoanaerobaculia bacterium]
MTQLDETVDLGPEPARIGPYRLARRLGRGGMGEVFLAWDERLGRRVALKRIRADSSVVQDRERLRREARAAAQLSHPSVVQIYDLVADSSGDVIVLEYVEGRTLREVLGDGLPSLSVVLRLAREIAEGLAAAHAAGLVHRDLKSENVMVTPEGRAKILDFGLAKPFVLDPPQDGENLTAQGVLLGTFHAMSPEQARGGEVDARSDLFSLGVLLYEMLTGRSPFQGSDVLDTLQKVCSHQPPPVSTLRPELPAGLSDLVGSLLAKRREERPRNAGEVARELGALAAEPGPGATTWRARVAELPTSAEPLPALRKTPGRAAESSALAQVRRPRVLILIAVLPILAAAAVWLVRRAPAEPLRVMVLAPRVPAGAEEELGLPAAGLLTAELATLSSLEGLAPLEPAQAGPGAASLVAAARTAAADEVIALALERKGPQNAWVSLRRIEGRTGRVLWAGGFALPAGRAGQSDRDLQLLADTVAVQLRHAYPDRRLRPGIPELDVSDRDYAEFLRVKERIDRGSADLEPELKKLEEIARSSPRFLEAHLLLAAVEQSLFESTRETTHLERARQAAKAAHELAAGDPRPLEAGFRIALAGKRPGEAQEALTALAAIVPSDPQLDVFAGLLAESRGDLARAVEAVSRAVQRAPSWHNLFLLADLELRAGKTLGARRHLEELLARNPGNPWGLDMLGRLELLQGDPERAIATYRELIRVQPLRPYYTNLGLAHSLLGRHAEAAAAYRQALALDPNHARVLLNLADAELAQEHGSAAAELYRRALSRFDEIQAAGALTAKDSMDKAQCLAHLGRIPEAVELTQKTLRASGDDAELFYAASLVYALAGDRASFLLNAKLALDNGMQPRWFTLPVFGALRNDPDLGALLRRPPA